MDKLLAALITLSLCCGIAEFAGKPLPHAYSRTPVRMHDVYRVSVLGCDNASFVVITVEVPFTLSGTERDGLWNIVSLDVDLRQFCR